MSDTFVRVKLPWKDRLIFLLFSILPENVVMVERAKCGPEPVRIETVIQPKYASVSSVEVPEPELTVPPFFSLNTDEVKSNF